MTYTPHTSLSFFIHIVSIDRWNTYNSAWLINLFIQVARFDKTSSLPWLVDAWNLHVFSKTRVVHDPGTSSSTKQVTSTTMHC